MSKRVGYNRFGLRRFDMLKRNLVTDGILTPEPLAFNISIITIDRPVRANSKQHAILYLEQTQPGSIAYFQLKLVYGHKRRPKIAHIITDRIAFCFALPFRHFALIEPRTFWPEASGQSKHLNDFRLPTLELLDKYINKELEDA